MSEKKSTKSSSPEGGSKKPAGNSKNTSGKKPAAGKGPFGFYWAYLAIGGMLIAMLMFNTGGGGKEIHWKGFTEKVEAGDVEHVQHDGLRVQVFLTESARENAMEDQDDEQLLRSWVQGADFWFNLPPGDEYLADLKRMEIEDGVAVQYEPVNEWGQQIVTWIIFLVILVSVWTFLMRRMGGGGGGPGGQIFNVGKSKAKLFDKDQGINVTFADVAGLEGAKEELEEIVDFLKHPKRYTDLGAKIPKGALLVGPPGTGKTLMAKAVAGEAQVPFFSLSGSDFVEMFVGVGASRVRDLFKQAKEKSPCIVFIDEIDAVGRARGKNASMGSNDERENTLNQLLTEMDGFGTNSGVILLAATNRADILDKALMRAGRFDRQIYVDMPDLVEREQIFKVHLKPLVTDGSIDVKFLAKQTPGFSGADIANICNEAALIAARRKGDKVGKQDFLDAVDRVVGGLEKRSKLITGTEKRTIAFHEAGHALVSWMLQYASPLVKVTIVPRGQSLGAAWYLPEERHITTTEQITDEMCAALGGRAAEDIVFGQISTGALSDLEKVTKQAFAMVTVYGLNEKIGNRSFYNADNNSMFTKPYSEATAQIIDEEIGKIIEKAYATARAILVEHKDKLTSLAGRLLEKEVLFREDLEKILGPRPFAAPEPEDKA
jgi:ATP-dependent metalloprotease FtsH